MERAGNGYTARMRRLLTFAVLCALTLAVAGCSQSLDKAIVGKFTVDIDTSGANEKDKASAEMMKAFMKDMYIEIKDGGKAEMSFMGQKVAGTWKLEDNKLTITPEKGGSVAKLIVEDGGKTMKPDPAEAKDMPKGVNITFKKQ